MSLLRSRLLRLLAVILAVGALAAACGSEVDAVSFGDTTYTRAELDDLLDSAFPDTADGNHSTQSVGALLSELLFAESLADELELEVSDQSLADATTALVDDAIAAGAEPFDAESPDGELRVRITAIFTEANEWIEEQVALVEIETPEAICSSHVLVASEEIAEEVIARLDDGDAFADVAIEMSDGPSGPGGGDLGCVATATFDADFIAGAREVAPAGTTGPVQSQFGWHVIEVRSFGPATTEVHPELDDAAVAAIEGAALSAAQQEEVTVLIEDVQADALDRIDRELELDPRYGTWDPVSASVVPPDGVTDPSPSLAPLDGSGG